MKSVSGDKDMLPEYDFSKGIRGKYVRRCASGTNLVLIDSDVLEFFPDQKSVNEALRGLVKIAQSRKKPNKALHTDAAGKARVKVPF